MSETHHATPEPLHPHLQFRKGIVEIPIIGLETRLPVLEAGGGPYDESDRQALREMAGFVGLIDAIAQRDDDADQGGIVETLRDLTGLLSDQHSHTRLERTITITPTEEAGKKHFMDGGQMLRPTISLIVRPGVSSLVQWQKFGPDSYKAFTGQMETHDIPTAYLHELLRSWPTNPPEVESMPRSGKANGVLAAVGVTVVGPKRGLSTSELRMTDVVAVPARGW